MHSHRDAKERFFCGIQDTGRGIDPEIMSRLFSKFATKSNNN
ncbi:MAG: hypothetical protein WBF33_00370 [Candidatus Nitrosopolaris sp.]|jgi:signal transduction histidine kinase